SSRRRHTRSKRDWSSDVCSSDLTKWIGLEATSILAKEREEELMTRFPSGLVDEAKGFDRFLSVVKEAGIAAEHGATAMHDITERSEERRVGKECRSGGQTEQEKE